LAALLGAGLSRVTQGGKDVARADKVHFELQFDPAEISYWAGRYDAKDDEDALDAGHRIAAKQNTEKDIYIIFEWKTRNRGVSRLRENEGKDILDALLAATTAPDERTAVETLTRLSGVGVPVASAILTAIHPDRYTVIDFRALEALGTNTKNRSLPFYLRYLRYCRETAERYGVRLRQLDRALWQWSKERGNSKARESATGGHAVHEGETNHERIAARFKSLSGQVFTTAEITAMLRGKVTEGSVLPNDHADGNKGACWCASTERRIFERLGRGHYRVR
jgi:hypothetical protein